MFGLEALIPKETVEEVDDLEMILELEAAEQEVDAFFFVEDQTQETLAQLKMISAMLENIEDVTKVEAMFNTDESFIGLFGEDSSKWASNINMFIEKQTIDESTEGMKTQDFFRWYGPFGVLVGLYMKSVGRVTKKLKVSLAKLKEMDSALAAHDVMKKRALYLPDADIANELLNGLTKLQDMVLQMVTNPTKTKIKDVSVALKKLGIATGTSPETATDWKAVGGSILGMALLGAVTGGLATIVGGVIGGHIFSDRGKPIGERGWDLDKVVKAMTTMLDILKKAPEFEKAVNGLKNVDTSKLTPEQKVEATAVTAMVKKSFKAYTTLIGLLGRGLASI